MIDQIRCIVKSKMGNELFFRYHGNRNQSEEFIGNILNAYPNVFLVFSTSNSRIHSFSYTDILVGNLEMKDVKLCKSYEKD